jgi:phosphoribosylformylglycinamidine (FGAM) synthase-like amidotransferase family enzyme
VESPTNNIIRSERRERLSFYDKLSTVGGILGLCNGMSALSIAECLLMICSLFYALLRIVGKRLKFICKTEKLNTTDSAEFKNDDDESDDESDEDLWLQLVELHVS